MDVPLRHTMTARATRERKAAPAALEAARCALVGNSFACSVVAYIFAHWAVQQGYLTAVPSVEEMRRRGGDWTGARAALHTDVPDSEAAGKLCLKKVGDEEQQDPSAELVMELIRRADPRGSDVRLDSGDLMRPDCWPRKPVDVSRWTWRTVAVWKWASPSLITALEPRGALAALRWRLRSSWNLASRFDHLLDNQASIAVLTRCRSTSYTLTVVVKRRCALVLAALARPFYGYCEIDRNPADAATRQGESSA